MNNKIIAAIVVLAIAFVVIFISVQKRQPGNYDEFAQCISDSGATFYGTFWCSHCKNQKAEFGKSADLLPYVECSTPDSKGQLDVCKDANITGYPTWEFADGSRLSGEVPMEVLSEKTGCELPE